MRRSVGSFALFITIALSLFGGMHYYAFRRLAQDPALPPAAQALVAALLVALGLSVFLAFSRRGPRRLVGAVHEIAFGWLGTLFILDVVLALGDLGRAIFFATARATTLDPTAHLAASRTQALVTAALGMGLAAYARFNAQRPPRKVEVPVRLAAWPKALDGLRLVQLSDVHVSANTRPEEMRRLVERVNALKPDVVAITGDLVDGSPALLREAVQPFAELRARLGVYFVTGNHEYYSGADAWLAEVRRLGVRVLQNERLTLDDRGASFELAGVPDWTGAQGGPSHEPRLAATLAGRDEGKPVILLAHQPKQFPEAAKLGVDFQLSGHTHGGQIFPFTLLVGLVEKHVAGLHREGKSQLYVSRGTRYWGPPMRLFAPHELTVLTFHPAAA